MQWSEAVKSYLALLSPEKLTAAHKRQLINCIDLTNLEPEAESSEIATLLAQAKSANVAAVCLLPQFISLAKNKLINTSIKIATVANFPQGDTDLNSIIQEIHTAIQAGAQEIDVVIPYQAHLAGNKQAITTLVKACRQVCGKEILLKVILETAALKNLNLIAEAAEMAILAGADFIKTSTGKSQLGGASLEAVVVMILVTQKLSQQLNKSIGVKVSGGVRQVEQAFAYWQLAELIMGAGWAQKNHFRLGASQLLKELIAE